jgi:hypothetical protein
VREITGLGDAFSSDMMLSAGGKTIWATHKMAGTASVIDLKRWKVVMVLNTGPETNHPNFVIVGGKNYG